MTRTVPVRGWGSALEAALLMQIRAAGLPEPVVSGHEIPYTAYSYGDSGGAGNTARYLGNAPCRRYAPCPQYTLKEDVLTVAHHSQSQPATPPGVPLSTVPTRVMAWLSAAKRTQTASHRSRARADIAGHGSTLTHPALNPDEATIALAPAFRKAGHPPPDPYPIARIVVRQSTAARPSTVVVSATGQPRSAANTLCIPTETAPTESARAVAAPFVPAAQTRSGAWVGSVVQLATFVGERSIAA